MNQIGLVLNDLNLILSQNIRGEVRIKFDVFSMQKLQTS